MVEVPLGRVLGVAPLGRSVVGLCALPAWLFEHCSLMACAVHCRVVRRRGPARLFVCAWTQRPVRDGLASARAAGRVGGVGEVFSL